MQNFSPHTPYRDRVRCWRPSPVRCRRRSALYPHAPQLTSYQDFFDDRRFAEGFDISLKKYAGMVSGSLAGLPADQMEAVEEVLSKPLRAGGKSIRKLFDQVIDYKPISGGGVDPDLLPDLSDLRSGKY